MTLTKFVGLLAGGIAITGIAQAENNDALAQIAELRAEIASLQSQNSDNWLTEARASEIRGIVTDVLADADTRSSFQGSNATSGYDNGFFISSADGNFRLNIGFLGQFAWSYANDADDDSESGFSIPNANMMLSGHVVDPSWSYTFEIATANNLQSAAIIASNALGTSYGEQYNTDGTNLREVTFTKDFGNGFSAGLGNSRVPFLRSSLLGDSNQLGVGYSEVDQVFSEGYGLGATVGYHADKFNVAGMLYNNAANGDEGPNGFDQTDSPDVAVRAEFLAAGDWAQFDKNVSFRGESFGMLIGAAYSSDNQPAGSVDDAVNSWTVDVTAMFGGFSAGFVWVETDNNTDSDINAYEVFGDFMLSENMDIYVSWDDFSDDLLDEQITTNELNGLSVGTNWYFNGTATRWTNEVTTPVESNDVWDWGFMSQVQISF